ncbi:hypothetical protein [Bradyrhizobium sp.]
MILIKVGRMAFRLGYAQSSILNPWDRRAAQAGIEIGQTCPEGFFPSAFV